MPIRFKVATIFFIMLLNIIFAITPKEVRVVNVTGASFTVVWYTDQAAKGHIEWGDAVPANVEYDLRGQNVSDNIHVVQVIGLENESQYVFRIKSNDNTYLNNGGNYVVKTGTTIDLPGSMMYLDEIYQLDSLINLVTNDILVFARGVDSSGEYSLPQAILYKNSYVSSDYIDGYRNYFDYESFRNKNGIVDPPFESIKIEFCAWTANEGFGGNTTLNVSPGYLVDLYLNTANLVYFDGSVTDDPSAPTNNPGVPTGNSVTFDGYLLEDFDNTPLRNQLDGWNYEYHNTQDFASIIGYTFVNDGADGSTKACRFSYKLQGSTPYAGFGLDLDVNKAEIDLSGYGAIRFFAKGTGKLAVELESATVTDLGVEPDKYNHYYKDINLNADWQEYVIPFADFYQNNWGEKVSILEAVRRMISVKFKAYPQEAGTEGYFIIDEIGFTYAKPQEAQNLNSSLAGNLVQLSWDDTLGATSYLVVRNVVDYPNIGSYPVTVNEGTSFIVTNNSFYEALPDDKIYYYSVFAYNNLIDLYSDSTPAHKPFRFSTGLAGITDIVTVNETILYVQSGIPTRSVRDNEYVNSSLTLIITVDSAVLTTTNNISLVINYGNTTITRDFYPTVNSNRLEVPLVLNDGINNLEIYAVPSWLGGDRSSAVNKVMIVEDSVKLKSGSHILCYPMPYNPNNGNMDIAYELTSEADVQVYIYNLLGQVVWKELYYQGFEGGQTGYNQISFNGTDAFGDKLAVGMYFIQIIHGRSVLGTSKFLVTR